MNCEAHPDREARLSPYDWKRCCDECFQKQVAEQRNLTPYQGKREAWDHSGYDHKRIGDITYTRGAGGYFVQDGDADNERRWK